MLHKSSLVTDPLLAFVADLRSGKSTLPPNEKCNLFLQARNDNERCIIYPQILPPNSRAAMP